MDSEVDGSEGQVQIETKTNIYRTVGSGSQKTLGGGLCRQVDDELLKAVTKADPIVNIFHCMYSPIQAHSGIQSAG